MVSFSKQAPDETGMVGSQSEADLFIFSTSFDPEFDHQHVCTTGNACNLPNSQPNDRIEIHTSAVPQSRSARILDPSQHPIPAHPPDHNLPQAPNRTQILSPSSPTGAIHPRSLKYASHRCFLAFHGRARFVAVFAPKMLYAQNVSSRSPPGCSGPADASCTTTPTVCPTRTARVQPARTIRHSRCNILVQLSSLSLAVPTLEHLCNVILRLFLHLTKGIGDPTRSAQRVYCRLDECAPPRFHPAGRNGLAANNNMHHSRQVDSTPILGLFWDDAHCRRKLGKLGKFFELLASPTPPAVRTMC